MGQVLQLSINDWDNINKNKNTKHLCINEFHNRKQ